MESVILRMPDICILNSQGYSYLSAEGKREERKNRARKEEENEEEREGGREEKDQ